MAKRTPNARGRKPAAKPRSKAPARQRKPSSAARAAKAPKSQATGVVYSVKITLDNVDPPIWREMLVQDCTLADLHDLIQISMGWENAHLHLFEIGKVQFGDPEQWPAEDPWGGPEVESEYDTKLSQLVDCGVRSFRYVYDMGDGWRHTVRIYKARPAETSVRYPRCIAGERACPPEDCGGPWGYMDLLVALQGSKTERQKDLLDWIGGEWDAEAFDLETVNKQLAALR